MELVFWGAVVLLLHTYFIYPLTLFFWDGLRQVRSAMRYVGGNLERRFAPRPTALPKISLVVPAHNEQDCIGAKLQNSLALDYPKDDLQIVVGDDGSSDATASIVSACRDPRVELSSAPRGGKVSVLNRCIPRASGEIVVLTDANTMIAPQALRKLVRHFHDPSVGAVCGRLRLYNRERAQYEESSYWSYESLIKYYEGKHGAVLGANGGIYAIRRSLFDPLPPDTIVDDFVIPLRILEAGCRVLYDPEAVAYEETTEDYGREFSRRARIAAGNFQSLGLIGRLLSPARGFAAYALWSHKVLRWSAPLLMLVALLANAFLLFESPLYPVLFAGQVGFYALAWVGGRQWLHGALQRIASIAYFFVYMNTALAAGFVRFLRKTQSAAWERTART